MFLTQMPINPRRRGTRVLLSSPQALHAAVLAGFADGRASSDSRVLWRLDTYGPHRVVLYVASPDKPDFTHLVEQAGWPTTETWRTRDYNVLLDSLREGQQWHFRLTANPVRSGRKTNDSRTQPFGHVTVNQQQQWLLDRANRLGFDIPPSSVTAGDETALQLTVVDRAVRRFPRQRNIVTLSTATFEGHLTVTDAEALRRTMTMGIGRGKAYGCGLLTLAPPAERGSP